MSNWRAVRVYCFMMLLMLVVVLILCSCYQEEAQEWALTLQENEDWELAVEENSIEGYKKYLDKWQDSKNSEIAKDEIAWLEANMTKTVEGFMEYRNNYNKYLEEVQGLIQDCRDWEIVLIKNDDSSFTLRERRSYLNNYLYKHPNGLFAEDLTSRSFYNYDSI